ncbi:MAG: hypothetical protein AVDCRST_MAG08-2173, partial [uncultured Acetobacteraceae bacterium]
GRRGNQPRLWPERGPRPSDGPLGSARADADAAARHGRGGDRRRRLRRGRRPADGRRDEERGQRGLHPGL